jgi:hypothetical protein
MNWRRRRGAVWMAHRQVRVKRKRGKHSRTRPRSQPRPEGGSGPDLARHDDASSEGDPVSVNNETTQSDHSSDPSGSERAAEHGPHELRETVFSNLVTFLDALVALWAAACIDRVFHGGPWTPRRLIWAAIAIPIEFGILRLRLRVKRETEKTTPTPTASRIPNPTLIVASGLSLAVLVSTALLAGLADINTHFEPVAISILAFDALMQRRTLSRLVRRGRRLESSEVTYTLTECRLTTGLGAQALLMVIPGPLEHLVFPSAIVAGTIYIGRQAALMVHVRSAEGPKRRRGSRFRQLFVALGGIACVGALVSSSVAAAVEVGHFERVTPIIANIAASPVQPKPSAKPTPSATAIPPPLSTPSVAPQVDYSTICGNAPSALPGSNIPKADSWARQELLALWLGDRGVGAVVGGCPAPALAVDQNGDEVWYAAGYSDGVLQSVGIASRLHGGALFLDGGIAAYVLNQLQSGVALWGSDRVNLANGDVQLVNLGGASTEAFIRATKHPTGMPEEATPLTVVPPAAVTLWVEEMRATGLFLWPSYQSGSYETSAVITLAVTPNGSPLATITTSSNGSVATMTSSQSSSPIPGLPSLVPLSAILSWTK